MSHSASAGPTGPPVAYLCSRYPAISHTFVMREVHALRRRGLDVETFTVRRTTPDQLLSAVDRAEAARTHHLLPTSPARLLRALATLLGRPRGGLALRAAATDALRLRRPGVRSVVWQGFYLAEAVLLWHECVRRGIRHVHAHFANVASDVALLSATLGTAIEPDRPWSFSWTMHGPTDFYNVREQKLAEKAARARFVACISDYARTQLMIHTPTEDWTRMHVIHCGVDPRAADASPPVAMDRRRPRLLNVGRLVPEKAQVLLVGAVRALRDRGLDVELEILGEGPARSEIERRIRELDVEDRVTLAGAVSQEVVGDRMRRATVFVLPSFAEGVPVVAMEAMALGVPVVASRIAGVPELIDDQVSGLLTTPGRVEELVDALERLLRDPELGDRLAVAGRRRIADEFEADGQAARLAVLFPGHGALAA